jgi:hypothetical protein
MLFHATGRSDIQTDGQTDKGNRFRNFGKAPSEWMKEFERKICDKSVGVKERMNQTKKEKLNKEETK